VKEAARSLPPPRLDGLVINLEQKQFCFLLTQEPGINSGVLLGCGELTVDFLADGLKTKSCWKL